MQPALLTRLRPSGPWRYGRSDGAAGAVDKLYRSDRLFSAVTLAMQNFGWLDEWLDATARSSQPALAFSSLFPFQGDTLFAIPPASIWPPPAAQVTAPNSVFLAKMRWNTALFVPLPLIDSLLTGGGILADQWLPDGESGCLLRRDRPSASPFRTVYRRSAAVDRLTQAAHALVTTACVEFEAGSGLWTLTRFRDEATRAVWQERIEGAFRLLADTGFGGRRTSGWGHAEAPEFQRGMWPALLLPKLARVKRNGASTTGDASKFWLLSLYSPAARDRVDWAEGDYSLAVRAGRVESNGQSGVEKKSLRMVAEGSVLVAPIEPAGAAVDVAPEHFGHPVYRSGLALALELPDVLPQASEELALETSPAEEPATEEALFERPCDEQPSEPQNTDPVLESPIEPDPETASEPPILGSFQQSKITDLGATSETPTRLEGHSELELANRIVPEMASFAEPAGAVSTEPETTSEVANLSELTHEPLGSHIEPGAETVAEIPAKAENLALFEQPPVNHPENDPVLEAPVEPDPETASEPPVKVEALKEEEPVPGKVDDAL